MIARKGGIAVWDIPTRLFHWLLVALFAFSWWSAENREMEWHYTSGVVVLALLVFRLIWGFVGGSTARFAAFVRSPVDVVAYLRRADTVAAPGHNPLGGYSVLALLAVLLLQVGTGLFATDIDGLDSGPLSHLVSFDAGRRAAQVHESAFDLLVWLVAAHVLAILFYAVVRRRNLVGPMITGKSVDVPETSSGLVRASSLNLALAILVAAVIAWWIAGGAGT
jgi:cytochrome b